MGVRELSGLLLLLLGLFDAIALQVQFQDHAVVYKPVDRGSGRHWVLEDRFPLRERQIAGDHNATPFIPVCQQTEQDLHLFTVLLDVAETSDLAERRLVPKRYALSAKRGSSSTGAMNSSNCSLLLCTTGASFILS